MFYRHPGSPPSDPRPVARVPRLAVARGYPDSAPDHDGWHGGCSQHDRMSVETPVGRAYRQDGTTLGRETGTAPLMPLDATGGPPRESAGTHQEWQAIAHALGHLMRRLQPGAPAPVPTTRTPEPATAGPVEMGV